jgi:hypothetical protein
LTRNRCKKDEIASPSCPIDDVSSLPGEAVFDQNEGKIGKIKQVYAGDGENAMWVSLQAEFGLGNERTVFIPIARLKNES